MKRFITNLSLYLGLVFVLLFLYTALLFNLCAPQFSGSYQASFIDKMDTLMSMEGPKIILVGNSNLAFGMDSALLSEKMGMNVVNLGLHGDLGNVFHESMAKQNIGEGDIVIVCHSDYDDSDSIVDPAITWITVENNYEYWGVFRPKDIPGMIMGLPKYLDRVLCLAITGGGNMETEGAYRRSAFNEYGDNIYPRPESVCSEEVFQDPKEPEYSASCIRRLNDLNRFCDERGATLLVAGWPIADGDYNFSKSVYGDFREELEEKLDCRVISDFKDYCYDYSLFYDTNLHLTDEGVRLRTEQLIEDLERWKSGTDVDGDRFVNE